MMGNVGACVLGGGNAQEGAKCGGWGLSRQGGARGEWECSWVCVRHGWCAGKSLEASW